MSEEEDSKPVNVDPRCIQEALRMYLQPIKNDDPQLDFYTMYKRETMEYDTEYMQKLNEDLNTTLIFAGLFSAVSSAFVIDVQSKLQPDPGERSEAYLRAILLSLNRSISPDEDPAAPPAWGGPPQEVITTSDLLYSSLLVSLLAAFVAMLGKQWLNRYLRHTGGSTIERCGNRQRKFDGLERWPFRLFIEGLPVMLQIALLLLTCGLSRHMWSVNTSVARVVISLTVLGFLFYIGIVVAGISSYECPFQTPVSMALRHLRYSETAQKWLSRLSPTNAASSIYATWVGFSVSGILSGIRRITTKIGHRVIILLLQMDRAFGNAKQRLVQEIRMFRRTGLLPTSTRDEHHQPLVPCNRPKLLVRVRNLEAIRRQNADNASCVCWVLRNITDPEAIDSAIRLAGNIRWFDGDSDHNPPFDLIVFTFETCFDSTEQLYPGMRDRAYYSARAILQIHMRARVRSQDHASKYPIPPVSADSFQRNDHDLFHLIHMLECNRNTPRPTLLFPGGAKNSRVHSLWLSNLFVDLIRVGPNPILRLYPAYLTIANTNHQATIANILLMWFMFLGGHVEEETIWAVDKSDSLETILAHLSTRVMDVIADGNRVQHLGYLLRFLAAWKERPAYLTPMAYRWCSAFSGIITGSGQARMDIRRARSSWLQLSQWIKGALRRLETRFTEVGPGCDLVHPTGGSRKDLDLHGYVDLLFTTLEIGFRVARPGRGWPTIRSNHASHHDQMFELAFSSDDDGVIADAVYAWIADSDRTPDRAPDGSLARYFAKRVERTAPFSRRLRQMGVRAICHIRPSDLTVSTLEAVRLLNRLEVDVEDVDAEERINWVKLLVGVIRSPSGFESLSSHNWRLLGELVLIARSFDSHLVRGLVSTAKSFDSHSGRDTEVMRSLEKAEDWEKLEVWMVVVWVFPPALAAETMQVVRQATLKLSLRQTSALQRFENLCEGDVIWSQYKLLLRRICDQARAEQSPSEPLSPSRSAHTQPLILLPFWGDHTI